MNSLRIRALELLEEKKQIDFNQKDMKELVQELNVYHIELEIQNQELIEKEAELLKSQEELSLLFMHAPIGYIVLNDKYCVERYNQKAFEIFEFRANRKETHIYSFFKDMSKIEKFMRWTNELNNEDFEIEIYDIRKNLKWVTLSHTLTTFESKNMHLFSVKDITEEKREKERLMLFESILEQLPVSIIITDNQGLITYVNKELLSSTGYSYNELISSKCSIFKSGHTSNNEYKELWETITNGKIWRGIFKNINKNNMSHWMSTTITPIFNEINEITHFISIETNIDEKVSMEKALKTQEDIMLIQARHAAMGEMISMIAHQWRQPLSLISTASTGIKFQKEFGDISQNDEIEALDAINDSAQYLSETINDFKNFFRKDKELEKVNAQDIIKKIEKLNLKNLKNNNIELIVKDQSTIGINTYSNELLQVLINLINNAKDILIEKKDEIAEAEIIIQIKDDYDSLVVEINDNAGGIPKDIIEKIFDPYFTTKGPTSGTGLGLYITKTIVDKHLKGSISVKNNEHGALFTIKIPDIS